jgi:hypothetical protein
MYKCTDRDVILRTVVYCTDVVNRLLADADGDLDAHVQVYI